MKNVKAGVKAFIKNEYHPKTNRFFALFSPSSVNKSRYRIRK